ncbi:hypothetical protein [Plastoroseomonas hellenica]|uniref:hypothetical protein n=1 Tax=Plastoroseomonas hellenica TaxID=2687306 RepID=UPI001BA7F164|nr:hypothetical protein [Plastoroseomonas hellenica]MBR0641472.1 hypothetical protein [Plastoroseomonas hellenica]
MNNASSAAGPLVGPMEAIVTWVYRGPHLFSHLPMSRIRLGLGALDGTASDILT